MDNATLKCQSACYFSSLHISMCIIVGNNVNYMTPSLDIDSRSYLYSETKQIQ